MKRIYLIVVMIFCPNPFLVQAGDVTIINTRFERHGSSWTVHTTLKHQDTGWKHYADAWRVVSVDGTVIGKRTLYHPHVDEQPFTRSLSGLKIPKSMKVVIVEAHDLRHGWSKDRVRVDLTKPSGNRFEVK